MGNLSGEFHEQNRKDKVTRFPSVTYAKQLGLLVNSLGKHLKHVGHFNSNAPQLRKSTHPRKCGNHVIVLRPSVRPHHRETNVYSYTFQLVWEPKRKLIAHQCCDQLTAVKTGYPLTSITLPYRGLKCRPIEVEYVF